MPATIERIRIFVASPGDVADERKRLDAVVAHLRTHVAAPHGLDLELVRWETHVRPGVAADAQAVVNPQIGAYDLFIGILWNRFGTPTGRAESGTREEFDQAYARWQRDPGSLEIWMYFSEQPAAFATLAELEQKGKVLAFRQELQTKKGALTWSYRDPADFETQVRGHLEYFIARFAARADHAAPDRQRSRRSAGFRPPSHRCATNWRGVSPRKSCAACASTWAWITTTCPLPPRPARRKI